MATKRKKDSKTNIGATKIFVAVPMDRAAENVRSFPTFTQDLYVLANWLQQCGINTVAMESTGVYWIPLFQILEDRGLDVCLAGERDPYVLAKLRNERIKASEAVIAKSLVGDYRPEHIFTLRQSLAAYRSYQKAHRGLRS